jgi:predicted amidohydrolase YtcJ
MGLHEGSARPAGLHRRGGGGATVVAGSHSSVPKAERGYTPVQAVRAGSCDNARFFRQEDRLGSVEPGKPADLVLVEGDASKELSALRKVRRAMLNGAWVAGN